MKTYRAKDKRISQKDATILGSFVEEKFAGKVKPKDLRKETNLIGRDRQA